MTRVTVQAFPIDNRRNLKNKAQETRANVQTANRDERRTKKVEAARRARQRHKSMVKNLKDEISHLQVQVFNLERKNARLELLDNLKRALPPERWQKLQTWLDA